MNRQVVLVVDDEAPMRKYITTNLKIRGYDVLAASDGTEALKLIDERPFDLLILDIMMPGPDGLEVLSRLRRDMNVPVLMLSARGRESDKVEALDAGADDYLTKPFGVEELLARVRAALRRSGLSSQGTLPSYCCEGLELDFGARRVQFAGQEVSLTPKEYDVLAFLARNAGKVMTHRQILQTVWGPEYGEEADYVWTYVRRLRRKLEPDPEQPHLLLTEAGVGYRMPEPV
ncbi:MAG: response regulator transcription factor [Chloroflexota bacterium]